MPKTAAPLATLDIPTVETAAPAAPVDMTAEAAVTVTTEIRDAGAAMVNNRKALAAAVEKARQGNAHKALGFASWTAYVADVFAKENMPRMTVADREYLAGFMAGEGMSSRAVALVLGVSQSTATRMVKASDVEKPATVTGLDGVEQPTAPSEPTEVEVKASTPAVATLVNRFGKAAAALADSDTTGLTLAECDEILAALADHSNAVKRFAASVTLTRKSAPVDSE